MAVLARHAGGARFAYNQCLAVVKAGLDARAVDASVVVPWSGFDLINAFNGWKRSAGAGRVFVVDATGSAQVVATGLAWRNQVCQQVFEEAAVDLGRGLAAIRSWVLTSSLATSWGKWFALEDLNITGMMRNHRLAGAIGDAARGERARLVTYKQQWRGGQVITVDRWYPSTKTCAACHTVAAAMPLSTRTFHCPHCGHRTDRDLNAATNLAAWAEQHHGQVRDPEATRSGHQRPPRRRHRPTPSVGAAPSPTTREPRHHRTPEVTAGTPEKGGVS